MKKFLISLLTTLLITGGTTAMANDNWDKTFAKSDKVNIEKVSFKNRYGIELVGDLYTPKNTKGKLPAIAISGPFGAVKEQASGLYAQTLIPSRQNHKCLKSQFVQELHFYGYLDNQLQR